MNATCLLRLAISGNNLFERCHCNIVFQLFFSYYLKYYLMRFESDILILIRCESEKTMGSGIQNHNFHLFSVDDLTRLLLDLL